MAETISLPILGSHYDFSLLKMADRCMLQFIRIFIEMVQKTRNRKGGCKKWEGLFNPGRLAQ
jgi:hypothetical protein